ncbi:hypothetical protein [Mesorhizobium sp.]|uniref:hypothetical protein n=1 Tax=Mesorhizobium sp. TaxID=1871066 RepID=UPI0025C6C7C6|nr:hypothetical protein [Mesorhizobium sp.]
MADLVGIAFSSLSKDNASRQKKLALSDVDPSERSAAAVATPASIGMPLALFAS